MSTETVEGFAYPFKPLPPKTRADFNDRQRPEFPKRLASFFVGCVIAAGLALFGLSLVQALSSTDRSWLSLAALTVVSSSFLAVRVSLGKEAAGGSLALGVSDIFVFAAILFYGPSAAVVISGLEGVVSSLRLRVRQFHKYLFNLGQLALVTFVTAQLFYFLQGSMSTLDLSDTVLSEVLVHVISCGLLYFALNSLLVSAVIALRSNQPVARIWFRHLWVFPFVFVANPLVLYSVQYAFGEDVLNLTVTFY